MAASIGGFVPHRQYRHGNYTCREQAFTPTTGLLVKWRCYDSYLRYPHLFRLGEHSSEKRCDSCEQ